MKRTLTGFLFIAFTLWALFVFASYQQAHPTLLLIPVSFIVFLFLVFLAMRGTGRLIYETLTQDKNNSVRSELASITMGFGILGLAMFLLGIFDLFHTKAAALLLLAMLTFSYAQTRRLFFALPEWLGKFKSLKPVEVFFLTCLSLWSSLALVFSLTPPHFYDTLVLYLGFPNRYAVVGGFEPLWHNFHNFMPQHPEMLYTQLILLTGSTLPAQLANSLLGGLASLAVYSIGRRFLSRQLALLGSLLFATLPGVWTLSIITKDDMAIALFQLVALDCILEWFETRKTGFLIVSALSAGLAAGSKYSGIYFVAALFGMLLISMVWEKRPASSTLKAVFLFALVSVAIASPWYLRTWVHTGNPLYPGLESIFGRTDYQGESYTLDVINVRSVKDGVLLPWRMTVESERFGFFNEIGPWFLGLLPFVFFVRRPKSLNRLLVWAALFFVTWASIFHLTRLVFSGVAVLGLAILYAYHLLPDRPGVLRGFLRVFLTLAIVSNVVFAFSYIEKVASPMTAAFGSQAERENWMDQTVPYRRMADFVNRNLNDTNKLLLVGETRMNYWNIPFVSDTAYDRAYIAAIVHKVFVENPHPKISDISKALKKEGFTHIVLNPSELKRLNQSGYKYFVFESEAEKTLCTEFFTRNPPIFTTNGILLLSVE